MIFAVSLVFIVRTIRIVIAPFWIIFRIVTKDQLQSFNKFINLCICYFCGIWAVRLSKSLPLRSRVRLHPLRSRDGHCSVRTRQYKHPYRRWRSPSWYILRIFIIYGNYIMYYIIYNLYEKVNLPQWRGCSSDISPQSSIESQKLFVSY